MIVTECLHCDEPQLYTAGIRQFGVYTLHTCGEYVVEVTRTDGTTYSKEHFESGCYRRWMSSSGVTIRSVMQCCTATQTNYRGVDG